MRLANSKSLRNMHKLYITHKMHKLHDLLYLINLSSTGSFADVHSSFHTKTSSIIWFAILRRCIALIIHQRTSPAGEILTTWMWKLLNSRLTRPQELDKTTGRQNQSRPCCTKEHDDTYSEERGQRSVLRSSSTCISHDMYNIHNIHNIHKTD